MLRLVILSKCLQRYSCELQLGLRPVRGAHGLRISDVHIPRQTRLRGSGGESRAAGFGI